MNPRDLVLVTDPRAGAFYGAQARVLEVNGDRARVAAKGRRPCELPVKWLAPVEEVDSKILVVDPKESANGFGSTTRNAEPLNEQGSAASSPPLGNDDQKILADDPKESTNGFGSTTRNAEPLNEDALLAALSALRDRLQAKGVLPGWIDEDRKGEQTYYRYRWWDGGRKHQAIAPKDLASYRDRVRRGQIVSHAEALMRLLEEEIEF